MVDEINIRVEEGNTGTYRQVVFNPLGISTLEQGGREHLENAAAEKYRGQPARYELAMNEIADVFEGESIKMGQSILSRIVEHVLPNDKLQKTVNERALDMKGEGLIIAILGVALRSPLEKLLSVWVEPGVVNTPQLLAGLVSLGIIVTGVNQIRKSEKLKELYTDGIQRMKDIILT